jgi:hypothetical protein
MEYVPGVRITDYCDQHRLDLRHRLELFREVCSAVLHAHQKGIVHRDLKPSNVLVTEVDGQPRVKVIDFGLAKALHGRLTDASLFTHFGVLLGTPAYMSPEQVQPSRLDIDTRTDVYSLGVLLYELLTGVLPFNYAEVKEFAIAELQHLLLELEPERPSQRLHALGVQAEELAQRRGADVSTLRRLLRDDLDWIVMHALERDRSRRYQSAGELAADIERHLSDEPVSAGPPSAGYRIRKLARRHRTAAAGIGATAVALLAGAIVSGVLFLRAEQARQAADAQRRVAERRGYVAELSAADASLRIGSVAEARRHLDQCPANARGWEWRHLAMRTDASFIRSHIEGGRIAAVAEAANGEIACVVVPPVYDEQHCASLWMFDPGRESWRRSAIEGSVLAVRPGRRSRPHHPVVVRGRARLQRTGDRPHARERARPPPPRGHRQSGTAGHVSPSRRGPVGSSPRPGRTGAVLRPDGPRHGENAPAFDPPSRPAGDLSPSSVPTARAWRGRGTTPSSSGTWRTVRSWGRLAGHRDGIIATPSRQVVTGSRPRPGTACECGIAQAGTTATIATDPVGTSVVFSPDGRRLAWGDRDGRVFVGEAANPAGAESRAAHRGAVSSLAFSPDGAVLASGGMEGEVWLWRTEPLLPLGVLGGHLGQSTPSSSPTMDGCRRRQRDRRAAPVPASAGRRCGPSVPARQVI